MGCCLAEKEKVLYTYNFQDICENQLKTNKRTRNLELYYYNKNCNSAKNRNIILEADKIKQNKGKSLLKYTKSLEMIKFNGSISTLQLDLKKQQSNDFNRDNYDNHSNEAKLITKERKKNNRNSSSKLNLKLNLRINKSEQKDEYLNRSLKFKKFVDYSNNLSENKKFLSKLNFDNDSFTGPSKNFMDKQCVVETESHIIGNDFKEEFLKSLNSQASRDPVIRFQHLFTDLASTKSTKNNKNEFNLLKTPKATNNEDCDLSSITKQNSNINKSLFKNTLFI